MNNKMVKIVVTSHLDGTVNHVMMDEMVKIINSLFVYYVDAMNNNRRGRQLNSPSCTLTMLNRNIPQMNLVCKTRKPTVATILKQLEYVTKGHIATQTILL